MSQLNTFPNQKLIEGVKKCDGSYIYLSNGKRILDLTAGGTSFCVLGWNDQRINDSIKKQVDLFSHIDYKSFADINRAKLCEVLCEGKNSLDFAFLSGSSGGEACDMALHMSYQMHVEEGNPEKIKVISRRQSYHGATSGSMALGERPNQKLFDPIHPNNVIKVSEPYYLRNKLENESETEYLKRLILELESTIEKVGAKNIGAFVGETILGGLVGDVPPPIGYWSSVKEICNKHNIHLILDEVWCGTGLSGKYNCYEHDNIKPDFMFLGKSLGCGYIPLSAVLTTRRFFDVISNGSGRIETSCTFQGHSIAAAAALEVQKIIKAPGFLNSVNNKGKLLRERLKKNLSNQDSLFNIRGRGVRNSMEYKIDNQNLFGQYISKVMLEKHNILISGKWHRFNFSHAMNIQDDLLIDAINKFSEIYIDTEEKWSSKDKDSLLSKEYY